MFEAKLSEGVVFKKIVESIKDLVQDVNIDISPSGKFSPAIELFEQHKAHWYTYIHSRTD